MLVIVFGQRGGGKTLRTVRDIIKTCKNRHIYTNFELKQKAKTYIRKQGGKLTRLKMEHMVVTDDKKNVSVS